MCLSEQVWLRVYDLSRNPVGAMLHRRQDQTGISRNVWGGLLQDLAMLAGSVQVGGDGNALWGNVSLQEGKESYQPWSHPPQEGKLRSRDRVSNCQFFGKK